MEQITVEPLLGQKLCEINGQAIVCDANGVVIGVFSPVKEHPRIQDLHIEPRLSIEETEKLRQKNRTGKPLEEILGRLGF
jgi:hypothetical protein